MGVGRGGGGGRAPCAGGVLACDERPYSQVNRWLTLGGRRPPCASHSCPRTLVRMLDFASNRSAAGARPKCKHLAGRLCSEPTFAGRSQYSSSHPSLYSVSLGVACFDVLKKEQSPQQLFGQLAQTT